MHQFKHFSSNREHYQSGQVGLVVILIMIVVLTIGISVISRSTQDLELTSQSETSTRVFNAAESEVESALSAIYNFEFLNQELPSGIVENDSDGIKSKYSISLTNDLETRIAQGATAEIVLSQAVPSGNLNIRWSRENCDSNPASLLISVYYENTPTELYARHYGVTINGCDNGKNDNLERATGTINLPYNGSFNLPISDIDKIIRITPLYNGTDIYIPASPLISQAQYNINSQAQNTAENKETNAINVRRTMPSAPSFMDFTLVSGANIIK